ncbi:Rho guanine nucleotide exchange factor, putative [Entamoeba invadens IP1]|uniref:Rho guanine nucleotide exchange factor, putative n=1 Tax=Entamoeba invadens IP1 TaxID=370355 RepID=A0A0A1U6T8_ENTIV|nr:Rho guanine nucleotide exchange factor, putative [Entamoeba invadens IP1]ELP90040.1 Rho guanine nucleotide exchange factor, putative [Entamoeba invadens IP1]|eukprot:XP_004256811.1 Rho guanine nucleotide exchange factor, putative [Entamoeba invadens IP1]
MSNIAPNNLSQFMMDLFPDQKECEQVLMEVTSDEFSAKCVEDLKFIDWKCIVGKLTVKQRGIIAAKIKEIAKEQKQQTEVFKMTGNIIKMNLFKPPKYGYQMDYRIWSVEQTTDFMLKNGISKTAATALKDLDGNKLVNFDEKKLGWFEGFKIKGEVLDKVRACGLLAQKELASTMIVRAARQYEFRKMNKLYAYRTNVAQELLSTEESYVQQLKLLVEEFVKPITRDQIIPAETSRKIFSDIEMILSVNTKFLESFQKVIKVWNSESSIGGLFVKMAPFLKIYGEYCKNYPEALKELASLGKEHKFYEEYHRVMEEKAPEEYKNFELTSFLITPIQRIPRYKLLLNDLLKHTPHNHIDYKDLSDGFNLISQVAISVNDFSKQAEHMEQVNDLSSRITELPSEVNFQEPGRIYQKDGILLVCFKKKYVPCHCILFSDICVFAEYSQSLLSKTLSKKFVYKTHVVVNLLKVETEMTEVPKSKEIAGDCIFSVISGKNVFYIGTKTTKEKDEWVKVFNTTIEKAIERKKMFEDKALEASKQKAEVAKNMLDVKYQSLKFNQTRKWSERGKSVAKMSCVEKWRIAQEAKQSMEETADLAGRERRNSYMDLMSSTPVKGESTDKPIIDGLVRTSTPVLSPTPMSPKPK